jgi:hypothetical protein
MATVCRPWEERGAARSLSTFQLGLALIGPAADVVANVWQIEIMRLGSSRCTSVTRCGTGEETVGLLRTTESRCGCREASRASIWGERQSATDPVTWRSPRREGRAAAPRRPGRSADGAARGPGGLLRDPCRRPLQAGHLPQLDRPKEEVDRNHDQRPTTGCVVA